MQRLSEDCREKSRYNLDYEQSLLFLSPPGRITRDTQMTARVHLPSLPRRRFLDVTQKGERCVTSKNRLRGRLALSSQNLKKKKKKRERETTHSLGTTWQSTLSRQLQFYLSKKARHGKFKHLSVLHNFHNWFIVIVLSDLQCDSSNRGTWKKIVQSGISENERFSSFLADGPIKFKIHLCNRWNLQNRLN